MERRKRRLRLVVCCSVLALVLQNLFSSRDLSSPGSVKSGKEEGPFFWEKAENCHAVENVCHAQGGLKRWFYFADDSKARRRNLTQPSLELRVAYQGYYGDEDFVDDVYFRVSSSTPKPTLSQLRRGKHDVEALKRCALSPVANHVVLQSVYNGMIGEFYSRSLLPLSNMMLQVQDELGREEEDLQFYVHLMEEGGTRLLDAHALFLSGLASAKNEAKAWAGTFAENVVGGTDAPPDCECYRRFVLCGYTTLSVAAKNCEVELEGLALPRRAIEKLCDAGFDLTVMNELNKNSSLLHRLRKAGIKKASKVVQFVRDSPANVALDRPAFSSKPFVSSPRYAFDGDMTTRWESSHADDQHLELDLGSRHRISKVVIAWEDAAAKSYDIRVSDDRVSWITVWRKMDGEEGIGTVESLLRANVTGRYVRMQGHERATIWGFSIWEMKVFGTPIRSVENPIATRQEGLQPPPEKITLVGDGDIRLANHSECSKMIEDDPQEYASCQTYANLRYSLLRHFKRNHPGLPDDIRSYRSKLIRGILRSQSANRTDGRGDDTINHRDWRIIGLTQRIKRRRWLNLNDTIGHCNANFRDRRILCVEVNVENLPSADSDASLRPGHEQLLLHRSLDALIGIHGAQLTQGTLLPPNSTVAELLPWAPGDYFGTGREVYGDWVRSRDRPTPLGIVYHNTDLRHVGYPLGRDSVPLCRNASNEAMHDFSKDPDTDDDDAHNDIETELEYCLYEIAKEDHDIFRWDNRDFVVEIGMIERFVDVFLPRNAALGHIQPCDELRRRGEKNNFVLYNVWCRDSTGISLKHYYQNEN